MQPFWDFLNPKISNHVIPLTCIIYDDPIPIPIVPPLASQQSHSADHRAVEAQLIAWSSHTHALQCDDISELCYHLEIAT